MMFSVWQCVKIKDLGLELWTPFMYALDLISIFMVHFELSKYKKLSTLSKYSNYTKYEMIHIIRKCPKSFTFLM